MVLAVLDLAGPGLLEREWAASYPLSVTMASVQFTAVHSLSIELYCSCRINLCISFHWSQAVWSFDAPLWINSVTLALVMFLCVLACFLLQLFWYICVHNHRKQADQGPEAVSEPALPEVLAWPRTAADDQRQPLPSRRALWVHDMSFAKSFLCLSQSVLFNKYAFKKCLRLASKHIIKQIIQTHTSKSVQEQYTSSEDSRVRDHQSFIQCSSSS